MPGALCLHGRSSRLGNSVKVLQAEPSTAGRLPAGRRLRGCSLRTACRAASSGAAGLGAGGPGGAGSAAASSGVATSEAATSSQLWTPDEFASLPHTEAAMGLRMGRRKGHDVFGRPRTPPPDLPSLLLHNRICFLGMPLVSAVTELIVAELMYLEYKDPVKPVFLYINSTGTTRADGETVGFETEATSIYDCMTYMKNEIHTVNVGVAMGQACMLLSAGHKGKRFMLEHSTAMLQQPRVPPTGQRQAIEIQVKWREVLTQRETFLTILSENTGHSREKLDKDMQRPLYMTPRDAIEYGIADGVVQPLTKTSEANKVFGTGGSGLVGSPGPPQASR